MTLVNLMTKYPTVITSDWTFKEAARKMSEAHVGILPVVEGTKAKATNKPIGVLTDRDIVLRCVADGVDCHTQKIADALTKKVVYGYENDTERDAFDKMTKNDVGRLLVKNDKDELTGIISLKDILVKAPERVWDKLADNQQAFIHRKDRRDQDTSLPIG